LKIALKDLPFISLLCNFFHNSVRQTGLTGVLQGENVQSFLFSIFLKDLEDYFCQNNRDTIRKYKR
jgi:hypothetical protein